MRNVIRRWLGVEETAGRVIGGQLKRFERKADAAISEASNARQAVANLSTLVQDMGEGHDDRLRALEVSRTDVGIREEIHDPVVCPNGHHGIITIQLIEEISAASPEIRHPIGGGYFCPTCGESFYQVGNHSWKPKSDVPTDVAPAAAPPGPAPVRRASPRFR